MIVGEYAVAFYGYPRFTKDIAIYFQYEAENIKRLKDTLCLFGFDRQELPDSLFTEKGNITAVQDKIAS